MKKIIALGGSNSKNSINKRLAAYAAGKLEGTELQILDLNDFELPIYSIDLEKEQGIPKIVFGKRIENNGLYKIPFSIEQHHALVDGLHVGLLVQEMEAIIKEL